MEKWKCLDDRDYQISNLGRVKSLKWNKERILKLQVSNGYSYIRTIINGKKKTYKIHLLVWDYFGVGDRDGMKMVVDHKDNNKINNNITNLQLLTQKQNVYKYHKLRNDTSSKYIGVCFDNQHNKWKAYTYINKHHKHIGLYKNEEEAIKGYELFINKKKLDKLGNWFI